jgi:nucleoside-diphosphate kinase
MIERSLVLMKPDAVQRGIVGEILARFERMGLKIVGAKLIQIDEEFGSRHYCHNDEWAKKVGSFNLKDCEEQDIDPMEVFGTKDPVEIGRQVDKWNAEFLSMGPVLALVLEGPHAVQRIRDHVGGTFSLISAPGTIRGDYGLDSALAGLRRGRTSFNMVHASGTVDEAKEEIKLWFEDNELLEYRRVHEDLYSY